MERREAPHEARGRHAEGKRTTRRGKFPFPELMWLFMLMIVVLQSEYSEKARILEAELNLLQTEKQR